MLNSLSDLDLIASFRDLAVEKNQRLALELEHLAELDRRKLFFHYSSLRSYVVAEHGYEESEADRKIKTARLMRRLPWIREKFSSGALNLTLIELARGVAYREKLSEEGTSELLEALLGMTKTQAQREIASRYPEFVELPGDKVRPIREGFSQVTFTADVALLEKLDEIRGLLAHSRPGITMAELIDVLASKYRERHHPEERAKRSKSVKTPSPATYYSPLLGSSLHR